METRRRPSTSRAKQGGTALIAFFYLIVAPIVLLMTIRIITAYDRRKNRLNLHQRNSGTLDE